MKRRVGSCLFALIFLIIFGGCEVGLGSYVDTKAPEISITYPPASSIIKEDFVVSGKCKDDSKIAGVYVTVRNNSTGIATETFEAEVNEKENTWKITLNKFDEENNCWPLTDGKYSIDVYAKDSNGKSSGTSSLGVEVDNTPPVLFLSKPLSIGSKDFASEDKSTCFGRSIKIAGSIADDHEVNKLKLFVYKADDLHGENLICNCEPIVIDVENFSLMSEKNPVVVANYYSQTESAKSVNKNQLRQNYLDIYNDGQEIFDASGKKLAFDKDGNKLSEFENRAFFTRVQVMDNAKNFRNDGKVSDVGNVSKVCYIANDNFYRSLQTEKTYSLDVTKFLSIVKGEGENFYSEEEIKNIKEIIKDFEISCDPSDSLDEQKIDITKSTQFILNPENSPYWKISGWEVGDASENSYVNAETKFRTYNSGTVNFSVYAGKDEVAIDASSIKLKLYKLSNYQQGTLSEEDLNAVVPEKDRITILENLDSSKSDTFYNEIITLTSIPQLKINEYYRFVLEGCDRNDVAFESRGKNYGFHYQVNSNPPEVAGLKINGKNDDTYFAASEIEQSGILISADVVTTGFILDQIKTQITVTDIRTGEICKVIEPENFDYTFDKTTPGLQSITAFVDAEKLGSKIIPETESGKYKFKVVVTAIDSAPSDSFGTLNFYADSLAPVITWGSVSPMAGKFVYGKNVKPNISIGDNNEIASVEYKINDQEETVKINSNKFNEPEIYIDSTTFGSDESFKLTIIAKDTVGNKSESSKEFFLDITNPTIKELTAPIVNKIFKETNILISGKVDDSEGSGLSKVYYYFDSNSIDAEKFISAGKTDEETNLTNFESTINEFTANKITQVNLVAEDKVGNRSEVKTVSVAVDTIAPSKIKLFAVDDESNVTEKLVNGTKDIHVDLIVEDKGSTNYNSGIANVVCTFTSTEGQTSIVCERLQDDDEQTDYYLVDIPADKLLSGGVFVTATDKAGNSKTENIFTISLDNEKPTAKINSPENGTNNLNGIVQFKGIATDNRELKNIKIYYSLSDSKVEECSAANLVFDSTGADMYSYNFDLDVCGSDDSIFDDLTKSTSNLYLKIIALDTANNSNSFVFNYVIDRNADRPVINFSSISNAEDNLLKQKSVSGSVSDDDNSIKGLWFTEDLSIEGYPEFVSNEWQNNGWTKLEVVNNYFNFDNPTFADGNHKWLLCCVDGEGKLFATNSSEQFSRPFFKFKGSDSVVDANSIINFTMDTTPPEFVKVETSRTGLAGSWVDAKTTSMFGGVYKNLYVRAQVKEEVGMNEDAPITMQLGKKNVSLIKDIKLFCTKENSIYTYVCGPVDISAEDTGTIAITLTAKDGVLSSSQSVNNIIVDNAKPVLKMGNTTPMANGYIYGNSVIPVVTCSDNYSLETVSWKYYLGTTVPENAEFIVTGNATEETKNDPQIVIDTTCNAIKNNSTAKVKDKITLEVELIDGVDNKYSQKFEYNLDIVNPEIRSVLVNGILPTSDVFYKNTSLTVTGTVKEFTNYDSSKFYGSGINKIYYYKAGSSIEENNYLTAVANETTGEYLTSFTGIIGDFESDAINNYVLVAEDKTGNRSAPFAFTVQIDMSNPNQLQLISVDGSTTDISQKLVSGKQNLKFIVDAQDSSGTNNSGISEVSCVMGGTKYIGVVTDQENQPTYYEFEIAKEKLSNGGVYVTAVDRAGNSIANTLFNLTVDNECPDIELVTPQDKATINGLVTFKGTASDNYKLQNVKVEYSFDSNMTNCKTLFESTSDLYNFEFTKNVCGSNDSIIGAATSDQKIYLRLVSTDTAGNSSLENSSKIYEFTISPDSDRPIITLGNISYNSGSGCALTYKNIFGSVSDDDGTVENFWYTTDASIAQNNSPELNSNGTYRDNGWTKIQIANNSWSLDLSNVDDGNYQWYFYVIDKEGSRFWTGANSSLSVPLIKYKDTEIINNTDTVKFEFSTQSPEFGTIYIAANNQSVTGQIFNSSNPTWSTDVVSFGNNYKYLYAKVTVKMLSGTLHADNPLTLNFIDQPENIFSGSSYVTKLSENLQLTGNTFEYIIGPITVPVDSEDGQIGIKFNAYSKTNYNGQQTKQINIDNTAPTVKIVTPGKDNYITKAITISGTCDDGTGSGAAEIYYLIPTYAQQSNGYSFVSDDWTLASNSSTWSIPMLCTNPDRSDDISSYVDTCGVATDTPGVKKIPIYFLSKDKLGNSKITKDQFVCYDEASNEPSCSIDYPTPDSAVGGTFTVRGQATGSSGVETVRVQLDVNDDGQFTEVDYALISSWNFYGPKLIASSSLGNNDWYILADGTTGWSISVDADNISSDVNTLGIRVCGYYNGKTKGYFPKEGLTVNINKGTPVVKDGIKLVQRDSSGNKIYSIDYKDGVFISSPKTGCSWYLEGSAQDPGEAGCITKLILNNTKTNGGSLSFNESTDATKTGSGEYTQSIWNFKMPVNLSDSDGIIQCTITVEDDGSPIPNSSTTAITINVDKTAPSMWSSTANRYYSSSNDIGGNLRLTSESKIVGAENYIQNSNTVYTFGDTFVEGDENGNGSGLNFVAVYFERIKSDSTKYIFNPMDKVGETGYSGRVKVDGTNLKINSNGLPSITLSGSGTKSTFTNSSIGANKFIRVGSMIYCQNEFRRINSIAGNTISFTPEAESNVTEVEFIYALIVDHMSSEGPTGNDYHTVFNDDGDGMIETLERTGNSYKWTATIFSDYIEDGPINVHAVAVDNCGNSNHGYVATSIQNNRPKISKVFLGTDLDGNGKFDFHSSKVLNQENAEELNKKDFGEFVLYSALNGAKSNVQLDSSNFKIKNMLAVVPEFVGGNNGIKYSYKISESDSVGKLSGSLKNLETNVNNFFANKNGTKQNISEHVSNFGFVIFTNEMLSEFSEAGVVKYIDYTFWDQTEETTCGTDSQFATLKVPAVINVVDRTKPNGAISKFYWNGLNENSIYGSQDKSKVKMTTDLSGHIELEDDWKLADGYDSSATSGIYDGDPKVSGKIVIKGFAEDDVKLSSLWINFADVELQNSMEQKQISSLGKKFFKVASYNESTSTWTTASATMNLNKWDFAISADENDGAYFNQDGHKIAWTLNLDTQIVANQNMADAKLIFVSEDGTGNIVEVAPEYKMDVVPYIVWLQTNLSSKDEENPSVYSRSALGRYQVRGNANEMAAYSDSPDAETVTVHGFNLGTNSLTVVNTDDNGNSTSKEIQFEEKYQFSVENFKSGKLDFISNGIQTLQNVNRNQSIGGTLSSYLNATDYYNLQSNNENNLNLTDDLEIDVWEFKLVAKKVSTELANPTVRINPNNGVIGSSYTNGVYFDMPSGVSDTQRFSHIRFMAGTNGFGDSTYAYDKNGYSYGAAQSKYDSGTQGKAGFFRLGFGKYSSTSIGLDNAYYGFYNTAALEASSVNLNYFPTASSTQYQNYADRIVSPKVIAVAKDDKSKVVTVHVAYADTATRQIRYRRSNVSGYNGMTTSSSTKFILQFNPSDTYSSTMESYYRITKLPDDYIGSLRVGQEVPASEVTGEFVKNVNYVDISYSKFLAGSSLRNVYDFDSNYQMDNAKFDLSSTTDTSGNLLLDKFPNLYWAVDFENKRVDQALTGYRAQGLGSKPQYPFNSFINGMSTGEMVQAPDSLQNATGQTIHVIASSGVNHASPMDVYKKYPSTLEKDGKVLYSKKNGKYKYDAGKSVALGVTSSDDAIVAWHDSENNKLNISYNTEEELTNAEEKVSAISRANGGTGGTLYGTSDKEPLFVRYVFYPYMVGATGGVSYNYYYLTNKENDLKDADNNSFADSATSTTTSYTAQTISPFIVNDTGLYCTPANSYRYKVMVAKTTTTVTKTKVTQLNGVETREQISSDTNIVQNYCFNSSNTTTGYGSILEKKILSDGKVIFVPTRARVIPTAVSDKTTSTTKTSVTVDGVAGKTWTETRTEVKFTTDYIAADPSETYAAMDGIYILASFPVYKVYEDKNSYMGCATENTKLSFERTDVWEDHGMLVGKGGAYVQMQIVDDIIHLAYYEEDTGAVKYTRIPFTSGNFGTPETFTVDSYNDVGENLTLDIAKDSEGNHIPYIGYYGNKRAKVAYLVNPNPDDANIDGAKGDKFTGVWEVCYVPTEKSIESDRINVAVRTDSTGKLIAGVNQKDKYIDATINTSNNNANNAMVYSNNTTNPVVGYINSNGNVEVAQKR